MERHNQTEYPRAQPRVNKHKKKENERFQKKKRKFNVSTSLYYTLHIK